MRHGLASRLTGEYFSLTERTAVTPNFPDIARHSVTLCVSPTKDSAGGEPHERCTHFSRSTSTSGRQRSSGSRTSVFLPLAKLCDILGQSAVTLCYISGTPSEEQDQKVSLCSCEMATVTSFRSPRTLIETGRTTIPELFEWHAKENPDYPLFRFHDGSSLKDISYSQAIRGIRHVARYVRSFAGVAERVPVAILANTGAYCRVIVLVLCGSNLIVIDSITYVLTSVGILRAGHIKFPISVRNGSAAVVELMRRTHCWHILVSEDEHMRGLAQEVAQELDGVVLHPMPTYEELLSEIDTGTLNDDNGSGVEYNPDDVAMILHSSGQCDHGMHIVTRIVLTG